MTRTMPIRPKAITTSSKNFIADKVSRSKKPRCCVKSNVINRADHKASERNLRDQMTTDLDVANKIKEDLVQETKAKVEATEDTVKKTTGLVDLEERYGYYEIDGRKVIPIFPR